MKCQGLGKDDCILKLRSLEQLQDVARCRRQAAQRYRKTVEDFLTEASCSQGSEGRVHLLLLDKNHPPSSLRNEVEVLRASAKSSGCHLLPKVLAIDFADAESISEVEMELLKEEENFFGPWAYPWNPNVIAECGARLLLRSSHDTLAGSETSLFVLLSFLHLHKRFSLDGTGIGIPVVKTPYLCTTGELASWAPGSESPWGRLEVRALLRQILALLRRPFEDQQKFRPLLAALVLQLRSHSLQVPDKILQQKHMEECAEWIWTEIFKPSEHLPEQSHLPKSLALLHDLAPAIRYVALDVDGHNAVIETLLVKVSMAIRAVTDTCAEDEPFQQFRRPKALHVTTCYLGSTVGDAERKVVAASKQQLGRTMLRGDGVPMADEQRPHITICTQLPWQPRHSNDVLEAVRPWLADGTVDAAGKWVRNVKVKSAVLDVFILQLERPVVLPSNPVQLC
eukprot:Skav222322  [mRNA]  locus=scaffold1249:253775:257191:+ [translate_table: standard]